MLKQVCNDKEVIINILKIDNYDGTFLTKKSKLMDMLGLTTNEDQEDGNEEELRAYVRFLTGVSDSQHKKANLINAFRSGLLHKLRSVRDIDNFYSK